MRLLKSLVVMTLLAIAPATALAITPQEVMAKTVSKFKASMGISGRFKGHGDQGDVSGLFLMDGTRSYIAMPGCMQWFDGRTQWTLNGSTKEVTVSAPSAGELADVNPLLYLNGYEKKFRLFFSKRKESGKYLVLLNPRGKSDLKAIEVAVNAKTMIPERMIVRTAEDIVSTVTFSDWNFNRKCSAGDFVFPKEKYKDYEIIDLR